jgi:hypothetical protein
MTRDEALRRLRDTLAAIIESARRFKQLSFVPR